MKWNPAARQLFILSQIFFNFESRGPRYVPLLVVMLDKILGKQFVHGAATSAIGEERERAHVLPGREGDHQTDVTQVFGITFIKR
jgi:hypothetical protein